MELNDDVYSDLIGIALTSPRDLPYIIGSIDEDVIPKGIYSTIYSTITSLYNLGIDVDIVTVSNKLAQDGKLRPIGGRKEINDIALRCPVSYKIKQIVKDVIKQSTNRKVLAMVEDFSKEANQSTDVDKTCLDYCSKISKIITSSNGEDTVDKISSGADEVIDELYRVKEGGHLGLDCGFAKINYFLGGLQNGRLYIIGGRPSMGKSAFAMNISEYIARDKNVLFVSLEMSRKEYASRLMLTRAGVYNSDINSGHITDAQIEKVKEQKRYLDSLNLFIETRSQCRVSDIEMAIIKLQSTVGSCDLVVIDYLQLICPNGKGRSRENDISEISRDLKALAIRYNIPVVVLSQLSRSLESRDDKRPMMSDLRESGAIEQDADVVMFVYRNEYYHPEDPASRGRGDILIRKNRSGTNNVDIEMCWRPSAVRFSESLEV